MEKIAFLSELRLKIPTYFRCYYPLVDLYLRQVTGASMLSMLPNSDLLSVPIFSINTADPLLKPDQVHTNKLFPEKINLFELTTTSALPGKEGLAQIRNYIRRGEPVIVSGTTYELPHSSDYHNSKYLDQQSRSTPFGGANFLATDHYVSVIGIGDQEVFLYDPIPNQFLGTIPVESFEKFWRGNSQFEVFTQARGYALLVAYGIINVTVGTKYQSLQLSAIAIEVLARVSNAFLEGRTVTRSGRHYLSGVAFSNYLRQAFSSYYNTKGEIPYCWGKCIFDLRWCWYYLRDFLFDLNQELNFPVQEAAQEILVVIDLWERVYKTFVTISRKGAKINDTAVEKFIWILDEAIRREMHFHCQLQDTTLRLG